MSSILHIRNCTAYRGPTPVFTDLTLQIDEGQHTVILGPNGAGKSTFLKLITQEIRPVVQPGSFVRLFGQERWNVWQLRDRLGMISDDLQNEYLPGATGEHVILSGFYSSIDIAPHHSFSQTQIDKARAVMKELDITDLKDREYGKMSTGQKRRFLLGRALIHDPQVLVLDEPSSGLDLKAVQTYFSHIHQLMRSGKTIILVTHHISEIPPKISRVILLREGRIIRDGGKKELLTSETLSALYGTPIQVIHSGGYYQVLPDTAAPAAGT
jgi:iron complex transport system ATP-binding protein